MLTCHARIHAVVLAQHDLPGPRVLPEQRPRVVNDEGSHRHALRQRGSMGRRGWWWSGGAGEGGSVGEGRGGAGREAGGAQKRKTSNKRGAASRGSTTAGKGRSGAGVGGLALE